MIMKNKRSLIVICCLPLFFVLLQSCGKDWLEAKPDKSLLVAKTIGDYQSLIDNSNLFNVNQSIGLAEIGAGDFFVPFLGWQSLFNVQEKTAYVWAPTENFYGEEQSLDWVNGYQKVLNANLILEGIEKLKPRTTELQDWNNIKGAALFFRAFTYFNLAQEYCVAYYALNAEADLGLPLRLESDFNVVVKRSNLKQTYDRIITDLLLAVDLLSTKPAYKTRPSKEAAYALLARTYLSMEHYEQAGIYAELALQIQPDLLDYKELNNKLSFPMERFNTEVIFQSVFTYGIFNAVRLTVEPALYDSYATDDRRKKLFFTENANGMTFKGSYNGDKNLFGGLATDELYLIRAEVNARKGALNLALSDLNHLRRKRWDSNYKKWSDSNSDAVLSFILEERRRELVFRGIRWTDLRRLNRDSRFAVTLTRVLNGVTYSLRPNDKRYIFPIDNEEIRLNKIEQNER